MYSLLTLLISGIFLFAFGYYLGHQMGQTEHIRQRLHRDRRQRTRNQEKQAQLHS